MRALLKMLLCVGLIAASCLFCLPARAQVEVEFFPPAEFIATSAPVYHEGRAAYWYRNRWYYREGRAWRYYHEEPPFLREHRFRREPMRHFYGRAHEGGFRRR